MRKWLSHDPQATSLSLRNRKAVFFTLGASDSIKWLDEIDKQTTSQPNLDKGIAECQLHQHVKPKPTSTRFLVDVPNSHCRLRSLDDREARLNLGLFSLIVLLSLFFRYLYLLAP